MGGYSRLEGPSTDRAYPNMIEEVRFAPDSALEGGGFEPSVPRKRDNVFRACARSTSPSDAARGTEGSNPAPSSGESPANHPELFKAAKHAPDFYD